MKPSHPSDSISILHIVGGLSFQGGTCSVVDRLAATSIPDCSQSVWMHRRFAPPPRPYDFVCRGAAKTVHGTILHDLLAGLCEAAPLCRRAARAPGLVLHAHTRVGVLAASLARLVTRVPVLVHVHFLANHTRLYRDLWTLARPALVFNSETSCRHFGFDPARAMVVYPSVEWPAAPAPPTPAPPRLVSASSFARFKNLHLTLEAAEALRNRGRPVECRLFGDRTPAPDPPYAARLRALAAGRDWVALAPWSDAWTRQLRASDVFVHVSASESFGISTLEAFAAGLRLVVRDGTFLDALPPALGEPGVFRVRGLSADAVAGQCLRALDCPLSAAELWNRRREAAVRFSASRNAARLADRYRRLAAGTPP